MTETEDASRGPSTRTHEVDPCPRCGTDHGERDFERMVRPLRLDEAWFTHWWRCATTGEPVLAAFPPAGEVDA